MSLTKEGDKVCRRKQLILFLSLFFCWVFFQPTICSAEKQVTMSIEQFSQLQAIMSEQENLLIQLVSNLEQSETDSTMLAKDLQIQQQKVIELQAKLKIVQTSLKDASNLIDRQNQSLTTLSKEIKQERRQAVIEKYKYAVYGILVGMLYGGMK